MNMLYNMVKADQTLDKMVKADQTLPPINWNREIHVSKKSLLDKSSKIHHKFYRIRTIFTVEFVGNEETLRMIINYCERMTWPT